MPDLNSFSACEQNLIAVTRVPIFALDNRTPAVRVEASSDETRLLIVEHSRLAVWDLASLRLVCAWPGTWLDAAIAGDGSTIAAVDFGGQLLVARVADGLSTPSLVEPGDPLAGVALGEGRIAASFASGAPVRVARFAAP